MYYNLKEPEMRYLERMEEEYMRKILNTSKGCPISQLYLELGQYPARFEVQKLRLLYLKYILEQPEESLVKKFFDLQKNNPTRGDWVTSTNEDMRKLDINLSYQEIKDMTKYKYSNLIKERISINALNYLKEKQ